MNTNQSDEDRGDQSTGTGSTVNTTQNQSVNSPAGTTQQGKSDTNSAKTDQIPNKRQKNPLSNLASYTYNITLYMITPDAYSAFIASGRRDINAIDNVSTSNAATDVRTGTPGAYILAQSGGVNNSSRDTRAPNFDLDYYIDNLKLVTKTSSKSTGTPSNTLEISFDIIEPYGFSFITKLKNARDLIMKNSKLPNAKEQTNSMKQFFVLGIRFYGYDVDGNVATGKEYYAQDTVDPLGNANGLYERFFDISIVEMKFKIDGRSTVYNVKAANLPEQTSMTNKNGRINKDIQIQASTVFNALKADSELELGLLTSLNREQQKMLKDGTIEIANEYDVIFIGESLDLKNSSIILDTDRDKLKSSMVANRTSSSTDQISIVAVPNLEVKQVKFKNDTSILQAISLIIGQSDYLYKAMNTVFSSEEEPSENGYSEENPGQPRRIRWYNLSSQIEILGFDRKKCDWSYKIKYIIQPYETPVLISPFANPAKPYYGPVKRYEYWYTGKNSEILRYEQQINNAFFTVALAEPSINNGGLGQGGSAKIPSIPNMRTSEVRLGTLGKGFEAQNTYITNLYDPKSWAEAKITILGDPDFLMNTSPNDISQVYNPYYLSDGFTINPNGGQVFIEIDFKEPEDYFNKTGLLSINESIQFVDVPPEVAKKVKGVSYTVIQCTSNFRGGKFTQDLDLILNTWGDIIKTPDNSSQQRSEQNNDGSYDQVENTRFASRRATGSITTNGGSTVKSNGFVPYNALSQNTDYIPTIYPISPEEPITVNTSADDDRG